MANTKFNATTTPSSSLSVAARGFGFEVLAQESFRRAVYLEQKRTERSRRKFTLMLASCNEPSAVRRHQILTLILNALVGATRETDIAGWYEERATLGIIFTEIGESDAEAKKAQQNISSRITGVLRAALDSAQFEWLQVSFYMFPDDWAKGGSDRPDKSGALRESRS